MKTVWLPALCLACAFQAHGGWYECYTYKGRISKYPITLSVQVMDGGAAGANDTSAPSAYGVYKYDKVNNPISLQGRFDPKTRKFVLKEYPMAVMEFTHTTSKTTGTWASEDGKKRLPVHLQFVSSVIDTFNHYKDSTQKSAGQALMRQSNERHYFIAMFEYDYQKYGWNDAVMTGLRVYDKKASKLIQEMLYTEIEIGHMTVIFDNLSVFKDGFQVPFGINKQDDALHYKWSPRDRKYLIEE